MGCTPFLNQAEAQLWRQRWRKRSRTVKAKQDFMREIRLELDQMEEKIKEIDDVEKAEQAKNRLTYLWTLFLGAIPNLEEA